jgi:NitT/TauT family transport system permease protein
MRWVNRQIRPGNRVLLGAAPVVILIIVYLFMAASRHAANPRTRSCPCPAAWWRPCPGC